MAKRRTASKPWELIFWAIGSALLFIGGIYMLLTEGFDLFGAFLTGLAGYSLISCIRQFF